MKQSIRYTIYNLSSICILLLILISCKSSKEKSGDKIPVIDIESNISSFETVNLSEIAESIEYIPLETTSQALISQIIFPTHLIIGEDLYIVRDNFSCKSYNKNGQFVCSYGSRGHGPEQFTSINRVSVDEKNRKLYLSNARNILEFSYSGDYIREIDIPVKVRENIFYTTEFVALGDNIYCGIMKNSNIPISLYIFNDNNKVLASHTNYYNNESALKKSMVNFVVMNLPFLAIGKEFLYKDGLCDTLFLINTDLHVEPAYCFNFGKYSQPVEHLRSFKENSLDLQGTLNHLFVSNFIGTENLLLFTCNFGNHIPKSELIPIDQNLEGSVGNPNKVNGIFNKQTSDLIFLKKTDKYLKRIGGFSGFVNDIDGGVPFWPITQPYGNQLVNAVNTYDLIDYVNSDTFKNSKPKFPEKKIALEQLASNLDYDDNPVLMVVTLKE